MQTEVPVWAGHSFLNGIRDNLKVGTHLKMIPVHWNRTLESEHQWKTVLSRIGDWLWATYPLKLWKCTVHFEKSIKYDKSTTSWVPSLLKEEENEKSSRSLATITKKKRKAGHSYWELHVTSG